MSHGFFCVADTMHEIMMKQSNRLMPEAEPMIIYVISC